MRIWDLGWLGGGFKIMVLGENGVRLWYNEDFSRFDLRNLMELWIWWNGSLKSINLKLFILKI